jgi:hypothetical protein
MIELICVIKFQPTTDVRSIVETLCSLPNGLRPTHYSEGEEEPRTPIHNIKNYLESLANAKVPPFLTGPGLMYDIGLYDRASMRCYCYLKVNPSLVKELLIHMAKLHPVFGFACVADEEIYRNRVTVKQGVNTIESWVGRETQKYLPGFYWLTLLPKVLAEKHDIPLLAVDKVAKEHIELEGGQHLFRFYDRPEDWQVSSAVTELCASLPGVFDANKVKPQLLAARNYFELNHMLKNWK